MNIQMQMFRPLLLNALMVIGVTMITLYTLKGTGDNQQKAGAASATQEIVYTNETFVTPVADLMKLMSAVSQPVTTPTNINPFFTTNYVPPPPPPEPPPKKPEPIPKPPPKPTFEDIELTFQGVLKSSDGVLSAYIRREDKSTRCSAGDEIGNGLTLTDIQSSRLILQHAGGQEFQLPFNQLTKLRIPLDSGEQKQGNAP